MAIENPKTYSDWYWKNSVEATAEFDENIEEAFAPYFRGIFADLPDITELPSGMQTFMQALAEPPSAGFGGFALGVGVEMIDETLHTLMNPMMKMMGRSINRKAKETWLTSEQANTLFRRGKIQEDYWKLNVDSEGYEDIIGKFLYKSQEPYPSVPDLVLYSRYHGKPDEPWSEFQEWFDVDARDWPVWKWLGLQRLTTMQVQTLFRRGLISEHELQEHLAQIGWSSKDRPLIEQIGWSIPNAMLLVQGDLQQQISTDRIIRDISIADINPQYARQYLDAILTKPSSQDIIAYELRQDPDLSNLSARLQQIGIHPDYIDTYKTLAYPIPPVADIITMAVREAFTPAIAERFGQYEDYPPEFEEWALKKGLSTEWSKRYWAAHWSLPSANQGFEMLHRGVIEAPELDMLLRALDIMPFWRKKLTGIAFRRLSRVDIRRMYGVGVLTENEVYDAYLELGYNERDARRMSDFTVKQILATQSKFTSRDIISAYTKYMITNAEARSLLLDVGVKSENVKFILLTADYKKEWALTDNKISAIRNLYKKEVYDDSKARSELLRLDMPAERVDVLMEQWFIDEKDKAPRYWTTGQTLGFIKDKIITLERGRKELTELGYDTEHISVYLKATQ
ncbi:hypothetical protein LCGC14_1429120 [marine sediment metagenome]|uniref:Uncharacterized protein n=1 Tax=marine sediment metagenome TaxID=412755 RepID=A0A0F9KA84_9ZZZZ